MYKVVVSNQCSCFKNSKMEGTTHLKIEEEKAKETLENGWYE